MKAYKSTDVIMMQTAAFDEGVREGKAQRDALVQALEECANMLEFHVRSSLCDVLNKEEEQESIDKARATLDKYKGTR